MVTININIKPTAGGAKINLDVQASATVEDLKGLLADKASMPASEQRLIYKGQILKDEKTLESYGARPGARHPRARAGAASEPASRSCCAPASPTSTRCTS
jgi:ubiquilin